LKSEVKRTRPRGGALHFKETILVRDDINFSEFARCAEVGVKSDSGCFRLLFELKFDMQEFALSQPHAAVPSAFYYHQNL
jgi:hypothetical protein